MSRSPSRTRLLLAAGTAGLLAGCGAATPATPPGPPPTRPQAAAALRGVRAQANQLLGGGARAFRRRLAALRSHPVVVNQWASWCGPCRYEFPFFQRLATKYDRRVAF